MPIVEKFKNSCKNQKEKLLKSYHPEVTHGFMCPMKMNRYKYVFLHK